MDFSGFSVARNFAGSEQPLMQRCGRSGRLSCLRPEDIGDVSYRGEDNHGWREDTDEDGATPLGLEGLR